MNRPQRNSVFALMAFALLGVVFAAFSSYDFIAHLDRQVHSITCSYIPGLGAADVQGTSGCHAVLMSPYSSVLRTLTWGGIPIALPALAIFAFLFFRVLDLWMRQVEQDRRETRFLLVATLLPVAASAIYFYISYTIIGAVCKLCVGIYAASLGVFISALLANAGSAEEPPEGSAPNYGLYVGEGMAFVFVPLLFYLALKPGYNVAPGDCGELASPDDKYKVRVALHQAHGGTPALELLDPLCPACKSFSERLETSGLIEQLDLEAVLFPLDKECNWMVGESLHPGAWDNARIYEEIKKRFPRLGNCVGKPDVRTKLNRSLRWAVANSLPVLTPQLYVNNQKLCDEDTDLGLEYALSRMLDQ
ncbi:MAG: hypothetical protein HYW07_17775 [Candidatus Latescibacteria bacterium]|nr:hypothetical protein [Candidatus Latescibacterota bacterium]